MTEDTLPPPPYPAPELVAPAPVPRVPHVVEITDREHWNGLVLGRPHYELEQGWEWGEVQRDSGWIPHRYAAFAGSACVGLASVASRRIPGLPYSVLDTCRGPLVDWDDDGAWRGVLGAIRHLADRERAIVLRVSPGIPHDNVAFRDALARHGCRPLADEWTTWSPARAVVTLRLDADEEMLRRRCRKSVRNEIAAAQRREVSVRAAHDRADLVAFHRLMVTAGRQKGYPVRPLSRLEALWRAYVVGGNGVLLLAEYQGALVGGLLGTRMGHRAYLQCTAVARTEERIYQGPLVYWEFIRWAKAAGCVHLDWGGSGTRFPPRETDQGYGLYQFKMGFGSELHYCSPYHDLVFRPGLYRLGRGLEKWALPKAWRLRALLNH